MTEFPLHAELDADEASNAAGAGQIDRLRPHMVTERRQG